MTTHLRNKTICVGKHGSSVHDCTLEELKEIAKTTHEEIQSKNQK